MEGGPLRLTVSSVVHSGRALSRHSHRSRRPRRLGWLINRILLMFCFVACKKKVPQAQTSIRRTLMARDDVDDAADALVLDVQHRTFETATPTDQVCFLKIIIIIIIFVVVAPLLFSFLFLDTILK